MSQTTLDDDELFGEAAEEMRADVDTALDQAREALPEPDAVWSVEGDNTVGVLNGLRTRLDIEEAETHLRDAKKWYTMGDRADAFDNGDDLEAEIQAIEDLITDITETRELVGDITGRIPELRDALTEVQDSTD